MGIELWQVIANGTTIAICPKESVEGWVVRIVLNRGVPEVKPFIVENKAATLQTGRK